ncbi:MAG TPA: hypothetical protein VLS93_04370 [Anaeromyxobacteraceae bacterium]|nr:hypothetical protein [Anaeromyxobacteraceae bacterium]
MRDRRWDFLYDRQRQPVREHVLQRFGEVLAEELAAWPPPFVDWVSDDLRRRWEAGLGERPRDQVFRLALELARLDLRRDFESAERRLAEEGGRTLRTPEEAAACHLLVRFLTEKCLGLKEHAERLRLSRDDLVAALDRAERGLFRVTLG